MALVALAISADLANAQAKKPNVVILATGGTIAGAAATGTQSGYKSGAVTIDAMLAAVPGISDLATVRGEQISNVGSQDMSFAIMMTVANRINELGKSSGVDGIVITHGTDTMVETAAVLAQAVPGKTIVLTGAMVPYAFGSSDGLFNLGSAISFAQVLPAGVCVAMNGSHFAWDDVKKDKAAGEFQRLR
jgi:L-asparaginase